MAQDLVLSEARRLHAEGFAIHWLHSKSKRPIEAGWTSGPRKTWAELLKSYRPGMNVGVRLGGASKIKDNFLAVVDVDVKSKSEAHGKEVLSAIRKAFNGHTLPVVFSGRGNGSRHYYALTPTPVRPFKAMQSVDIVKVHMPSAQASKRELSTLTPQEIKGGIRLRAAWEISVMGEGQQVVLPPSTHPDSGRPYTWRRAFNVATANGADVIENLKPSTIPERVVAVAGDQGKRGPKTVDDFAIELVELSWLPIDKKMRAMIVVGTGVEDRSSMLLPAARALYKAGCNTNEVLTVLTDPANYLGGCAYDHAKTRDRTRAARWLYKYTVAKIEKQEVASIVFAEPIEAAKELSGDEIKAEQKAYDAARDWRDDLKLSKNDGILPTLNNVLLIMENEGKPDLMVRDLFANRDTFKRLAPWGAKAGELVTDGDAVDAKAWLGKSFNFEPPKTTIEDAFDHLARKNSYDPVKVWLEALPEWDGVGRVDTWLANHFEAGKDEPEYLAQVFRKWLSAMVIRVYNPGAKFDWLPIFEGHQGFGKSSFGRILVGDKYFLDQLPNLADKDAALALQGIWAVEFGELATFRKNELEIVKGFVTRTIDKVRPPYGRRTIESARRCVFFGTTNKEKYLRDETGNRRFKPVQVGRLDFEQLHEDRDQLFAEALWCVKTGFENVRSLELDGAAKIYEGKIQNIKMVEDDADLMVETLKDFFEAQLTMPENERFNFKKFKLSDLFIGGTPTAPPLKNWKYDSRNMQFAGRCMKLLGAAKFESGGRNYWKLLKID